MFGLELEILEEMLFSMFVMFFAAAVSVALISLSNYVSNSTTISRREYWNHIYLFGGY
ncbi:MAG: hypothetical protein BAJATHORv1_60146 [Candidatus Thorarchaeota archaeon]|nr:MAG: hypothetical protein BAJATHORv1_60146 [Candidatus Thorarchaeota archaeon]